MKNENKTDFLTFLIEYFIGQPCFFLIISTVIILTFFNLVKSLFKKKSSYLLF